MDSEHGMNYVEYSVERKPEGSLKLKRALLMTLYIIFIPIFIALLAIPAMRFLIPFIAITPIFLWMLIYFTWRYVSIENKYTITTGVFTFTEIYGKPKKDGTYHQKDIVSVRVADMLRVLPLADAPSDKVFKPQIVYTALSSSASPDAYLADFTDAQGRSCRLTFDATEKTLKVMKIFMNDKDAIKITKVRY